MPDAIPDGSTGVELSASTPGELPDPGETLIPSGASILAAKQKRDRLRAVGASAKDEDDFISLEVARKGTFKDEGPHPSSWLMREDDDLGDGDDGKFICVSACGYSRSSCRYGRVHWRAGAYRAGQEKPES